MSLKIKITVYLLAGILAGMITWVMADLSGITAGTIGMHDAGGDAGDANSKVVSYCLIAGSLFGLLLGMVDAVSRDTRRQLLFSFCLTSGLGLAGGLFGSMISLALSVRAAAGAHETSPSPFAFLFAILFGAIPWSFIGLFIGMAQGLSRNSPILARQSGIAGLSGGFAGGIAFQIMAEIFGDTPLAALICRLIGLIIIGGLIGLALGLMQYLTKTAWLYVANGQRRGKEILIARPITTLGSSEDADVGIFGDPSVAPVHAQIEGMAQERRHRLRHVARAHAGRGAYPPTYVNDKPMTSELWLTDGDTVRIGNRALIFRERSTYRENAQEIPEYVPSANNESDDQPPLAQALEVIEERLQKFSPDPVPLKRTSQQVESTEDLPDTYRFGGSIDPDKTMMEMPAAAPAMDSSSVQAGRYGIGGHLVCIRGPYSGQSFPTSHAPVYIGRSAHHAVTLAADSQVSRTHARMAYVRGRHIITDVGSSNGVFVNGEKLAEPRALSIGDIIQIGVTLLRYE